MMKVLKHSAIRILICTTLAFFMWCCASETQKKGLDKVSEVYNCGTSFVKEVTTDKGKLFTVKVSRSAMLDTLQNDITACNIGLIIYNGFSEEEKDSYDEIRVEIQKPNNKKYVTSIALSVLNDAKDQLKIFNDFSKNIVNNKFDKIAKNVKPEFQSPELAQSLSNFMKQLTDVHGDVTGYKRLGFGTFKTVDNENLYYYSGHLEFEDAFKKNYFITTSKDINKNHIEGFDLNM